MASNKPKKTKWRLAAVAAIVLALIATGCGGRVGVSETATVADCRDAKLAIVGTYEAAVAAHRVQAEAQKAHIETHHTGWGQWQTWGELLEARAAALEAEAAAAYAQVAANEACAEIDPDDYEAQAGCAADGRSLLASAQKQIEALDRLHDADWQDTVAVKRIEAEVARAQADISRAEVELSRDCSG